MAGLPDLPTVISIYLQRAAYVVPCARRLRVAESRRDWRIAVMTDHTWWG
jgi:hypothetical protein